MVTDFTKSIFGEAEVSIDDFITHVYSEGVKLKESGTQLMGADALRAFLAPPDAEPTPQPQMKMNTKTALKRKETIKNSMSMKVNLMRQQKDKQDKLYQEYQASVLKSEELLTSYNELNIELQEVTALADREDFEKMADKYSDQVMKHATSKETLLAALQASFEHTGYVPELITIQAPEAASPDDLLGEMEGGALNEVELNPDDIADEGVNVEPVARLRPPVILPIPADTEDASKRSMDTEQFGVESGAQKKTRILAEVDNVLATAPQAASSSSTN